MKVRVAISPDRASADPGRFDALVDGLEARGFDGIWLSDVPVGPTLDPLVGLAHAAGRTTRLKLGANVVPFGRSPFVLAKGLAQLDRLSRGRVLLSLVPGLDQRGERDALGIGADHRGRHLDEVIPLLRAWWAGQVVTHDSERFHLDAVALPVTPHQQPLEMWLGGVGPAALDRAGRLSDGWLGAALTPVEAGRAVAGIVDAATKAGRTIDPEHFGLSIPYFRDAPDPSALDAIRSRRADGDIADIAPIGRRAVRDLVARHVAEGLSKFVLRPSGSVTSWDEELDWLADTVLDLQT